MLWHASRGPSVFVQEELCCTACKKVPLHAGNPRLLATFALPRLALFGALPPSLVPQLLPVTTAEDRRAGQLAYHLLQVQLGIGNAGTPTLPPTKGRIHEGLLQVTRMCSSVMQS